ncbi:MAG: RNA binding S1 domain protein [Candidatus Giovannonibacteria bacterium GW2011_GWC2_44_9]|uniref:RNA binding S1 domain protein n=1 Tax=Candidatus Giovannonibacteria bacterium GW2011_GWC2_44_9 TaxID=1618658 RepID=A0A0G1KIX1_9BACT|nr:MAG: RNA binding S1 domain protein [Candidatus Giovannonibacteria bacterium GW2011_GWC2_44_9]
MVNLVMDKDIKPNNDIMDALLKAQPKVFLKIGDLIEGQVLEREGAKLFLDLGIFGTGIIYGQEYQNARELIKNLKPEDKVTAKIVELENENGFVELSLKEAGSEMVWKEAKELKESQEALNLKVVEANKGGVVLEWRGIKGFLPASQLKASHYPRVEGGEKEKIFDELRKLVGEAISVTILDFDPKENKLIFSEKGAESEDLKKVVEKYKVGDIIEGEITGVVDFGIFIKLEEGLEGLAHISELDWALVENPNTLFKVGEQIKSKIISIDGDKISLSVKALKPDPWETYKEKYKKGDIVEGKVLRLNKFGALVTLDTGIYGLAHISEFGTERKMREMVLVGESYFFQIVNYKPEDKKLSLSFLGKKGEAPAAPKEEPQENQEK